jgi:phosphoribosylglycinamide formyltransferase-1
MSKLVVLVSGGGTNLQAILDAFPNRVISVIADRDCYSLVRAANAGVVAHLVDRKLYRDELSERISALIPDDCDLIVLAGFLSILDSQLIQRFPQKIINIHPSLLPRHGGAGMWGIKVHQAAISSGDQESGCTVHYVSEEIDGGAIIAQAHVAIEADDTADSLQQKVLAHEHKLLVGVIKKLLT